MSERPVHLMLALPVVAALVARALHDRAPPLVEIAVRWSCLAAMLVAYVRDVARVRATSPAVRRRLGKVFVVAPIYLWRRNAALGRQQATTWAMVPVAVAAYLLYPVQMSRESYEALARQVEASDPLPRCDSGFVRRWLPVAVEAEWGVRATASGRAVQLSRAGGTRRCVVGLDTDRGDAVDAFDVTLGADGTVTIASDLRIHAR